MKCFVLRGLEGNTDLQTCKHFENLRISENFDDFEFLLVFLRSSDFIPFWNCMGTADFSLSNF